MLRGAAEREEWIRIASATTIAERSVELRSAMRYGLGACGRAELSGGWQPTRLTSYRLYELAPWERVLSG